jgi:hypothetical protein
MEQKPKHDAVLLAEFQRRILWQIRHESMFSIRAAARFSARFPEERPAYHFSQMRPLEGNQSGNSSVCVASATAVPNRESSKLDSFLGLPAMLLLRLEET